MTTDAATLSPCPFCGRSEHIIYHDPKTIIHPWYQVRCDWCGACGPCDDHGNHVDSWNGRAAIAQRGGKGS